MPPVALLDALTGENVTQGVLDPARDYFIVVYAGLGFEFLKSVVENPPAAAELFQTAPLLWRPTIRDAVESTPNYVVYPMPSGTSSQGSGECSVTLAAGLLRRSDSTYSRPRQFGISYGFFPTVSFTDGISTDLEHGGMGTSAWLGNGANGTLRMIVTAPPAVRIADANATDWVRWGSFYVGDGLPAPERLPGGLRVLTYSYSELPLGNSLEIILNVSGVPPGQYPITIKEASMWDLSPSIYSVLGAPTNYKSLAVTAWLKVGLRPSWHVFNADTGVDVTGQPAEAGANLQLAFVLDGEGEAEAIAALGVLAAAGAPAALPQWGDLVSANTLAAVPLASATHPTVIRTPTSLALAYPLSALTGASLSPGSYLLSSAPASGAVCNGAPDRQLLCSAREVLAGILLVGFRPFARVFDGASQTRSYGGALDAAGTAPLTDDDKPQACFAPTISVVFSDVGTGSTFLDLAWQQVSYAFPAPFGSALVSFPPLPPPATNAYGGDGTLVYTWSAASIVSGVYDVTLVAGALDTGVMGSGVSNVRVTVRMIVGPQLSLMGANTTILASGSDAPGSAPLRQRGTNGPFVTAATAALLRITGPQEAFFSLAEVLAGVQDAATGLPVKLQTLAALSATPQARSTALLRADYAVGLSGLVDGVYQFTLRTGTAAYAGAPLGHDQVDKYLTRAVTWTDVNGFTLDDSRSVNLTVVIARAPWVGTNLTLPAPVGIGGLSGEVALPAGLFTGSPLLLPGGATVELVTTPSTDARGLVLAAAGGGWRVGAVSLPSAVLISDPATVTGPPGPRALLLRATSEAGAVAEALLTINFMLRPIALMTAWDPSRGVSNGTVLQVKPTTTTPAGSRVAVGLDVAFDEAVHGGDAGDIVCSLMVGAADRIPCSGLAPTLSEVTRDASGGVTRYRWSITVVEADANRVTDVPGAFIVLSLRPGNGIVGAVTGLAMLPAGEVRVLVDAHSPMFSQLLQLDDPENPFLVGFYTYPGKFIPSVLPIVGVPYHYTLPMYMMDDQFSPSRLGGVRIVGPEPAWVQPYGMVLTGGPLGRATLTGTAVTTLNAPNQAVFFNVIAEDLAGNRRTYEKNIQIPILPAVAGGAPNITMSGTQPLKFTEGDRPLYVDTKLSLSLPPGGALTDVIGGARIILEGGEANATFHGAQLEMLETLNPCPQRCTLRTFHNDVGTGFGKIELYPLAARVDGLFGHDDLVGNLTLSDALQFFRAVRYINTRMRISSIEPRRVRMQILKKFLGNGASEDATRVILPQRGPLDPLSSYFAWGLLAGAVRTIIVVPVNNPPVVALQAPLPAATWVQPFGGVGSPVAAPLTAALNSVPDSAWVSDVDDFALFSASVVIDGAGGDVDGEWGSCDRTRDYLSLPPDYRPVAELYGEWTASSCTLVLTPAPPLRMVSYLQMRAALAAVKYSSLVPRAPTGWGGANATRRVLLSVVDTGASSMTPLAASVVVPVRLHIRTTELPYQLDAQRALEGFLSSTDPFAALKAFPLREAIVYQRKWPLVLPGINAANGAVVGTATLRSGPANCTVVSATAVRCVLLLDLAPVAGVNGSWARGAITHPYALNGPRVAPKLVFLSGGEAMGGQLVGASEVALEDAAGSGAAALRSAFAPNSGDATAGFAYSAQGLSTLTLVLARAPPDTALGEFTMKLTYAPAAPYAPPVTVQFGVDLMRAGCVLSDSADYMGTLLISSGLVYPENSLCRYPPVEVRPDAGVLLTRGSFAEDVGKLEQQASAAIANGATFEALYVLLKAARSAARGGSSLDIPPRALGSTTAVTVSVVTTSLAQQLPPPPPPRAVDTDGAAPRIDMGVALELGPPGTVFSPPFSVCILVGDVPLDQMVVLVMTSLVDPNNPSQGYTPWETMQDGTFDATTGKACGKGSHFSVVAPLISGLPRVYEVPKYRAPSGSCPQPQPLEPGAAPGPQCSGNGACEENARCRCFAGFTGAACSQRTCPTAESWGQTLRVGPMGTPDPYGAPPELRAMHSIEECAGRGACNRATGVCDCAAGYEGAACQRMACPRRVVKVSEFLFLDDSDMANADMEAAWEAAFLEELNTGRNVRDTPVHATTVEVVEECSGRGRCLPVDQQGQWGSGRIQRCVCDAGWTGGDCSLRKCPLGVDLAVAETYARRLEEKCAAAGTSAPKPNVQRLTLSFPDFPETNGVLPVEAGSDQVALAVSEPLSGARLITSAVAGVWAGTTDAADGLKSALAALPGLRGGEGLTVAPVGGPTLGRGALSVSYDFLYAPDAFASFGGSPPLLSCRGALTSQGLMGGCTAAGCRPRHRQLRATKVVPELPAGWAVDPVAVLQQPDTVPGTGAYPPASGWAVQTTLSLARVAPGVLAYQWVETTVFGEPAPSEDTELTPLPPLANRRPLKGPMGLLLRITEDDDAQAMDDLNVARAGPALGPWRINFAWRLPTCTVTRLQDISLDSALQPSECSDRGLCDRAAGKCACFAGWQGTNCDHPATVVSV